jgi:xanthine dehydrogenase YagR molybdenum-binding subunit
MSKTAGRTRYSQVGHASVRYEGAFKVTGAAHYAADRVLENMAHAVGVFSTIGSGEVLKLDLSAAEKAPGVLAILHPGNVPRLNRVEGQMSSGKKVSEVRPPFADEKVYYAGQYLAAVVAETFEQARAAARLVKITYRPGPNRVSMNDGQWANAQKPMDDTPDEQRGDPEAAWQSSEVQIDCKYETAMEVHNPMELHATVAVWKGPHLEVHDSTQWVAGQRTSLAAVLGVKPEQVTVIAEHVGGGFGGKLFLWPHTVVAAVAARLCRRPVKLVLERKNEFTTAGHRPATHQRIRLGAKGDGTLASVRHDSISDTSMVSDFLEDCAEMTKGMYRARHFGLTERMVPLNVGTPTSMRAPGAASGSFALESAMDELACTLALDPIELRRRNFAARDPGSQLPWSSNHLLECYETAAGKFGWQERNPRPGSMTSANEILGWGFAAAAWPAMRQSCDARVEFSGGRARVYCATQDIGTGTYTVIAQVAAEVLGIPLSAVEVAIGRSDYPKGPISGGSMATATFVPAVMAAAQDALRKLRRMFRSPRGATPELLARLGDRRIVGEGTGAPGPEAQRFSFRSFGAHCVEVRWDPGIARLRVSRVVSVFDIGQVMNRTTAANQVYGSIVMGLGMALLETVHYDARSGRCLTDNLADYTVPVNADTPEMDVHFLDYPDGRMGGFGGRGVGEIGITGVAAAIANAIHHATGKRFRSIPIRTEDLLSV